MQKTKIQKYVSLMKLGNTATFVAIIFLWMGILVSSNYSNNQNLLQSDLSKNIRLLEDEMRLLNTTASQLQTTERLENESMRLELVKVQTNDIYYVDNKDSRVALR